MKVSLCGRFPARPLGAAHRHRHAAPVRRAHRVVHAVTRSRAAQRGGHRQPRSRTEPVHSVHSSRGAGADDGAWRDYYGHWRAMTRDTLDPRLLELAEPLARLCPPARILDKAVYSAFADPRLAPALASQGNRHPDRHRRRDRCVRAVDRHGRGRPGVSRRAAVDALCSAQRQDPRRPDDPLSRTLHESGGNDIDGTGPAGVAVLTVWRPTRRAAATVSLTGRRRFWPVLRSSPAPERCRARQACRGAARSAFDRSR